MKKTFGLIGICLLSSLCTNVLAWTVADPEIKKQFDYVARAKKGTTLTCEGEWEIKKKFSSVVLRCDIPHRGEAKMFPLYDLTRNGWEVVDRHTAPHSMEGLPEGLPGWRRVVLTIRKVKVLPAYLDELRGPMAP